MRRNNLDSRKKKLAEAIELYRSQAGMTYHDLADMVGVSYLKLKRWASASTFPQSEKDLNELCTSLSIDKSNLFKIRTLQDRVFHSLEDLLKDYCELSGDSLARSRTFLLAVSITYSRLLQLPNTNLVLKKYSGPMSNVDVSTEAVFFTSNSFGLLGCHDAIKYYVYPTSVNPETETFSPCGDMKIFNSSVLDSFIK